MTGAAVAEQQDEETMQYYLGVPIADILKVAGLNPDLTTNMGDPRNVAYIGPLEDPRFENPG